MIQKAKYSSREEQALAEAGKTMVSPAQKRLLATVFLLAIFLVPLGQQALDLRAYFRGERKTITPQCYEIFDRVFSAVKIIFGDDGGFTARVLKANRALLRDMHSYENALEDSSIFGRTLRPFIQYGMIRWLGAGNDKTYAGRSGWLFYRPDVDYAVNHGFLEESVMKRRAAGGSETASAPHPDPRPAILEFNAELAARGIKLIVMPTPVKPAVHPEKFSPGFASHVRPVHNSAYNKLLADLRSAGVLVFDAAPELTREKRATGRDQFLAGDTHWRPEAMELCARRLGVFISQNADLAEAPAIAYTAMETNITQKGDIVAMLRIPEGSAGYGRESVTIRRILDQEGRSWQADKEAEVLLLGDSFCNIYSLEEMGWGQSAGLVEQLSYELRRPVDLIAVNDHGAWAARELLARDLAGGSGRLAARSTRLANKKVVVWQFAEREFTEGDWKILPLDVSGLGRAGQPCHAETERPDWAYSAVAKPLAAKAGQSGPTFLKLSSGEKLNIIGIVKAIAPVPRPHSVPYADHIIAAHLVGVADSTNQYGQAYVYLMSMTNHVLTRAAGLRAGARVSLTLRPWADVSAGYERINRTELDDPELLVQEPCWGN